MICQLNIVLSYQIHGFACTFIFSSLFSCNLVYLLRQFNATDSRHSRDCSLALDLVSV